MIAHNAAPPRCCCSCKNRSLARAPHLITGSPEGLGHAAPLTLVEEGHDVVLHARSHERDAMLRDLAAARSAGVGGGDLGSVVANWPDRILVQ